VGDDCSTDGTLEILNAYKRKFPDLITVLTSKENTGPLLNEYKVLSAAKGTYIAYCEGDDYWTDPHKLRKQVDFLEANTDYSVCFHRCRHYDLENNAWKEDNCGSYFHDGYPEGVELTMEMFFRHWITQPLTMVYRHKALDLNVMWQYSHYRDIHQIYHLLRVGRGYLFAFEGGVRNMHPQGFASMKSLALQCSSTMIIAQELYEKNHTADTKKYYEGVLQWCIYEYCGRLNNKKIAFSVMIKHFILKKSLRRLGANCKWLFK
jgi:glycosyltransferase involved in cell wall biosynthesis